MHISILSACPFHFRCFLFSYVFRYTFFFLFHQNRRISSAPTVYLFIHLFPTLWWERSKTSVACSILTLPLLFDILLYLLYSVRLLLSLFLFPLASIYNHSIHSLFPLSHRFSFLLFPPSFSLAFAFLPLFFYLIILMFLVYLMFFVFYHCIVIVPTNDSITEKI